MDTNKEKSKLYYKTVIMMMRKYTKDTVLKAADLMNSKMLLTEVNGIVEQNLPEADFIQKIKELEQKKS